jgi:hypothetical protein
MSVSDDTMLDNWARTFGAKQQEPQPDLPEQPQEPKQDVTHAP